MHVVNDNKLIKDHMTDFLFYVYRILIIVAIISLFIVSYAVIYGIGSFLFGSEPAPNSLQAAVTFGGINFLALFIYFILAIITTTVLFFTLKNRGKQHTA